MGLREQMARISIERKKAEAAAEAARFQKLTEFMTKEANRENRAAAHRKNSKFVAKSSSSRPKPSMESLAEEEE
jgi:hypothetical protein